MEMNNRMNVRFGIAVALLATVAGASAQIQVTVDGKPVAFGATKPIRRDGRVLVPLRGIFEAMGAGVKWDSATQTVTATKEKKTVVLFIGQTQAKVDGMDVRLDAPAMIVNGATLVPLRFVSEALGADVNYKPSMQLVAIKTSDDNMAVDTNDMAREEIVQAYTVVPVVLNSEITSTKAKKGDRFIAKVEVADGETYAGIPAGSYVEGHVAEARPKKGDEPGVIDLAFDRIRLPNNASFPLDGSLYSLEENQVERDDDGVLKAKNRKQDNRVVYAGYGAGAGLLVGLLSNGRISLEKALIGGVLGGLIGQFEKKKPTPSDVKLASGSRLGLRLNKDLALKIDPSQLR
jgi:hypothetical protein